MSYDNWCEWENQMILFPAPLITQPLTTQRDNWKDAL